MKTKTEKQFGNSKAFGKDVLFPKHLTPKIMHGTKIMIIIGEPQTINILIGDLLTH